MSRYIQRMRLCDVDKIDSKSLYRYMNFPYMGSSEFEGPSVRNAMLFIAKEDEYQIHEISLKCFGNIYPIWVICNPIDRVGSYC